MYSLSEERDQARSKELISVEETIKDKSRMRSFSWRPVPCQASVKGKGWTVIPNTMHKSIMSGDLDFRQLLMS